MSVMSLCLTVCEKGYVSVLEKKHQGLCLPALR